MRARDRREFDMGRLQKLLEGKQTKTPGTNGTDTQWTGT